MLPKFLLINDYLESLGNLDVNTFQINEIDFAIFTVLSYADYEALDEFNIMCDKGEHIPITFFNDEKIIKTLSKRFNNGAVNFQEFFRRFINAKRYKNMYISRVQKYRDKTAQFYAMTLVFDGINVVVFRGTDNTIAGWKEDVLTCLKGGIFAQRLAATYLQNRINLVSNKKYYVCGSSKGGNLSYYSYFNLDKARQNKIIKVYNFDGNGFRDDEFNYDKHKNKLVKFLVEDDFVGTLFEHKNNLEISASTETTIFAHDLLTWKINPAMPNSFLRVNELSITSEAFKRTGSEWFRKLSNEDVHDWVNFIFTIFDVNNPETLKDMKKYLLRSGKAYLKTFRKYEKEKRNKLIVSGGRFILLLLKNIKEITNERKLKND